MLKKLAQASLLTLLLFCSASQAESVGYETLSPAQPTQHPDKVEVIEFFWYGCPHCYAFEPELAKWLKKLPKNVEFIRQPAVFSEQWGKHAKAYFVAESLGVVDKVHTDLFDAIQNKKQKLDTEEEQAAFFVAHGVDAAQFHDAYKSFAVDSKMRQAPVTAARYGITGVPTVVINGKYVTSGPIAGSHEKMLEVMDTLIKQESAK
ncbi:thiol:disulfide interchange protein DsbA/DsbL [Methylovulum psychrotolerans]|jgi:thiol:disulfide interchange protein DsbA|uniref:Thiol:disulfide interchange protein n=1 Tax=Methylovulum psychrotolerans TaxID=1704499 RepID=A0A2S5CSR1_9GAMM|nr:thiol:disulfide interchange protein DsbA/DsbL [Methylovulum psychrotolerans]MBT9098114.1 thiol:disulfide interchange protein DsbA/DsbL [Methylovulum psychrotolerans]POZ53816.1 disulfide bond formation protein DsbA [Methylovulum psychrotolerans]